MPISAYKYSVNVEESCIEFTFINPGSLTLKEQEKKLDSTFSQKIRLSWKKHCADLGLKFDEFELQSGFTGHRGIYVMYYREKMDAKKKENILNKIAAAFLTNRPRNKGEWSNATFYAGVLICGDKTRKQLLRKGDNLVHYDLPKTFPALKGRVNYNKKGLINDSCVDTELLIDYFIAILHNKTEQKAECENKIKAALKPQEQQAADNAIVATTTTTTTQTVSQPSHQGIDDIEEIPVIQVDEVATIEPSVSDSLSGNMFSIFYTPDHEVQSDNAFMQALFPKISEVIDSLPEDVQLDSESMDRLFEGGAKIEHAENQAPEDDVRIKRPRLKQ